MMSGTPHNGTEEPLPHGSITSNKGKPIVPRKNSVSEQPVDLDYVLINELGQFGRFQLSNLLLVSIPIIMSSFMSEYIFSAAAISHRCQIPECGETTQSTNYDRDWLSNAIPETSSGFASCERFMPVGLTNGTLNNCPIALFDQDRTVECDGFIYARQNSVVYDFDLGCQEWFRTLAGTLNSLGTLLVLPFIGYISDMYGRRVALVISIFNFSLFGLIRAFSVNYTMYLAFQLLQMTLGGGIYSSAYVFAAELVGPNYRVVTTATCASMFAVGQVVLAGVAWFIESWRNMIIVLHVPCFLAMCYYWILSENIRWLLTQQKFDEAKTVLEKVAKVNKKQISEKSMQALMSPPSNTQKNGEYFSIISVIFRSKVLLRRVCTTPIWWITTTFVYYGLSINATSLSDTIYLNYILISAIEIPGSYTSVLILDRIGRKATLSSSFFFSACCNIAFVFIPNDMTVLRLIVFLLGKFGISVVFSALYVFTSELYPTQYRHSLLGFSSMVGRIGSITAPMTPVLMEYWDGLPSVLFGALGFLSGFLVLTQPETLGTKMPDTLAEAEALGRPESKLQNDSL